MQKVSPYDIMADLQPRGRGNFQQQKVFMHLLVQLAGVSRVQANSA